jgi:hypothetical protein
MPRKVVDWEAVELRYRTGTESLRSIAADFEITEGAIRQRAKKEDWSRDLSAKVRLATEAAVLRKAATHDVRTEKQVIAVEAEMRSTVILRQRVDVVRSRNIVMSLLSELEQQTGSENVRLLENLGELMRNPDDKGADKLNDLYHKIISLPGRSKTMKDLGESLRVMVTLERQAYGIEAGEDAESTVAAATGAAARALSDAERAVRLAHLLRTPGAVSPGLAAAFTGPDA